MNASVKTSITKNMRKTLCFALALALTTGMLVFSGSNTEVKTHAATIEELQQKLEEYAQKQEELDNQINATRNDAAKEKQNQQAINSNIATTEEKIRTLKDIITEYGDNISDIEDSIETLENNIAETEEQIADQKAEIDENIELYKKRLRAMYLSGHDSMASILVGASDFYDMLMKMELVKRMAEHDNALITGLIDLKDEYEANQALLESAKSDLGIQKNSLEDEKAAVEVQKSEMDNELSKLNTLYSQSADAIRALEAEEASYRAQKAEIDKMEEDAENQIKSIIAAMTAGSGEFVGGSFLWPVPGYYYISSGYGTRWGTLHKGIDIAGLGISGQPIVAANAGTVIAVVNTCPHNYGKNSNCCGNGYGRYCMIDHGGGYVTLYGHATNISVNVGDVVSAGQQIGTVGTTGYSTGYHCHFEIRVDGTPKDPQSFDLIK